MKERCKCGKDAVYMYLPEDREGGRFLCEQCVPQVVNQYEFSEHGFIRWTAHNEERGGDENKPII